MKKFLAGLLLGPLLLLMGLMFIAVSTPPEPTARAVAGTCVATPGKLPELVPQPLNSIFTEAAEHWGVDPLALAVLYHNENGWTFEREPPPPYGNGPPWAVSPVGATGAFQFMPATWQAYKNSNPAHQPGNILDLTDQAYAAAHMLANNGGKVGNSLGFPAIVNQEGTLLNAIVSHHSGPGFERVGLGPAGRQYMAKGYEAYQRLQAAGGLSAQGIANTCTPANIVTGEWQVPLENGTYAITSRFGVNRGFYIHDGIDLASIRPDKKPPIRAALGGTVKFAGYNEDASWRGIHVVLEHGTVDGKRTETRYHHMSEVTVTAGQVVQAGDEIGKVGNTGNVISMGGGGYHLHFAIDQDGKPIDPEDIFAIFRR